VSSKCSSAATVPRLGRAFQILRDLDLTDLDDGGSADSQRTRELEACLPRDSSAFSLLDVLSETGFSISDQTYCCYFPFYEEVVLRRLLDKGCTNNILLVTLLRCAEAFASEDTRLVVRRDYTLLRSISAGHFIPNLC